MPLRKGRLRNIASVSAGNVTVTLQAITSGFARGLTQAGGQLKALQKQVQGIASSFKFIGGFAALGGIGAAVESITEFQDNLGALKGVLSSTIKDSGALEFNVSQLGLQARKVALDTGFLATELVRAEVEFVRAGISAKATGENLKTVADLARTENLDVGQAAEIATNILLGLDLTAEEFRKTVDLIVSAANSSSTSVLELAESFKLTGSIATEFNQKSTTLAAALGILGNAGIKGGLAGTSLRQIFKVLVDDFGKGDSVLKRFNISLFEGGEKSQTVTSKFRQVTDILGDLRKNAGTATEFVKIFQSRALAGSLVLSRQTSEELAKLAQRLGDDVGSAARIGAFRLETLRGQFNKLKATVQEFFLALGFQGGLVQGLTEAVQGVTRFVAGLSRLNPRILQFISALIIGAGKVLIFTGAFIALASAAALALSPLGQLVLSITALTSGPSLFEKFKPQLEQLGALFLATAKFIGGSFTSAILNSLTQVLTFIEKELRSSLALEGGDVFGIQERFTNLFGRIADGVRNAAVASAVYTSEQKQLVAAQVSGLQVAKSLGAALDKLDAGTKTVTATYDVFAQTISQAEASLREIRGEYDKLLDKVKTENPISGLIDSLNGSDGAQAAVEKLQQLNREFEGTALLIENVKRLGSPAEVLLKGQDQLRELLTQVEQQGLRPFDVETMNIVRSLEILQAQLQATGGDPTVFDPLIEAAKQLRGQLDTVTVDLAAGFKQGFRGAIQGVLEGTREFDFGDVLRQGLVGAFTEAFDKIILEKFKFDAIFKRNFVDLGQFAQDALSGIGQFVKGLFGGGNGGTAATAGAAVGGGIKGILGSIASNIPFLAEGGIATSPQLAVVGDSREAIIPLDRLKEFQGGGGGKVAINVITTEARNDVAVQQSGNGMQKIFEIFVGQAAKSVTRGGALRQALNTPQVER